MLKQNQYQPIPVAEQIVTLLAVIQGVFDDVALDKIGEVEKAVRQAVREQLPELYQRIEAGKKLSESERDTIANIAQKTNGHNSHD